jgi:hypothetical protein
VELAGDKLTLRTDQFGGRFSGRIERVQMGNSTETFPSMRGDYTLPDSKGSEVRFWIEAMHMAPVVKKDYPDEPGDATGVWGTWQYQLTDDGKVVETGTVELTNGKAPREGAWARMTPTEHGHGVLLRSVGSKLPQPPTDKQLEELEKSGKAPTQADFKTVEGFFFSRFDGLKAISLSADLQSDGTLLGSFWKNGEKLSFAASLPR